MEVLRCPCCGAHINENNKFCAYCGSAFKNVVNEKKDVKIETQNKETENNTELKINSEKVNEIVKTTAKNVDKLGWGIIILLTICVWPVGVILIILKSLNKVD